MTKNDKTNERIQRFTSLIKSATDKFLIPTVKGNAGKRVYWVECFNPKTGETRICRNLTRLTSGYVRLSSNPIEGWVECATANASCLSMNMHRYEDDEVMFNTYMAGFNKQSSEIRSFARTIIK